MNGKTKRTQISAFVRILSITLLTISVFFCSCERVNDFRIPVYPVNIDLSNQGLWDSYGVHVFGQHRYFIRDLRQPDNFPFSAGTYTGFGGVLLISGYSNGSYNEPLAFDLACPVEIQQSVRVTIDNDYHAVCPKCGSKFDVTEGHGRPISGKALELNYGMTSYKVLPATYGGYTILR